MLNQFSRTELLFGKEAMQRLEADGFTHVAVQSTHVMHGEEYEKMLAQLEPYRLRMQISVGMPLLHAEADYAEVADALSLGGKTDEENLGFTYAELDRYIRTGVIEDQQKKARIDHLHAINQFKLELMPAFRPDLT